MRLDVKPVAEFSAEERGALLALTAAVYPPEKTAVSPGRAIQWSSPEHGVLVLGPAGELVAYVGIVVRAGRLDGAPVKIGGVGSVKTHPVAFSLLVCQDHLQPFYGRLGWRAFTGRPLVEQPAGRTEFTINRPMVRPGLRPAPEAGLIDLAGPPW